MKQHNYKAGDKVRIIGNDNRPRHGYSFGDVVDVIKIDGVGVLYCDHKGHKQYVNPRDVEPSEATFTLDDIKAGYLLEVKNERGGHTFYLTVIPSTYRGGTLGCCCPGEHWMPLEEFDKETLVNTINASLAILRVYGPTTNKHLLDNTTEDRGLLWERQEKPKAVKMTVAEISEKLGYDVEIVKEK